MERTLTLNSKRTSSKKTPSKKLSAQAKYITAARRVIRTKWRYNLYNTIYRSETTSSKAFAIALLLLIGLSSTAVILETVKEFKVAYGQAFNFIAWSTTILFSIEYILRIICLPKPKRYILSSLGVLDFLAIFPAYLGLFGFTSVTFLMVIRLVRLFRLFRVFNLVEYTGEAGVLVDALKSSRHKITVFIVAVMISVTIIGSLMYVIEGPKHGFNSIPRGIYWAIVTITTVGYGDMAPQTYQGQALASLLMLLGFSTIVVPTSIVSAEIAKHRDSKPEVLSNKECFGCGMTGHDLNASYCKYCGSRLWDDDDD